MNTVTIRLFKAPLNGKKWTGSEMISYAKSHEPQSEETVHFKSVIKAEEFFDDCGEKLLYHISDGFIQFECAFLQINDGEDSYSSICASEPISGVDLAEEKVHESIQSLLSSDEPGPYDNWDAITADLIEDEDFSAPFDEELHEAASDPALWQGFLDNFDEIAKENPKIQLDEDINNLIRELRKDGTTEYIDPSRVKRFNKAYKALLNVSSENKCSIKKSVSRKKRTGTIEFGVPFGYDLKDALSGIKEAYDEIGEYEIIRRDGYVAFSFTFVLFSFDF